MSNVFVIIKTCFVHNQWYDISCATLYTSVHVYNVEGLPMFCNSQSSISQRNLEVKRLNVIVDHKSHQFSHVVRFA